MIPAPTISSHTDTLLPYRPLCRSRRRHVARQWGEIGAELLPPAQRGEHVAGYRPAVDADRCAPFALAQRDLARVFMARRKARGIHARAAPFQRVTAAV